MKPVYVPESAPGLADLQMENDLLMHENRLLRARLESQEPEEIRRDAAIQTKQRSDVRNERFRQAYYDMRWFVRRLNGSPIGFALRRWEGFRVLVQRYGRDDR